MRFCRQLSSFSKGVYQAKSFRSARNPLNNVIRTIYRRSPVQPSEYVDEPQYPPVRPQYPPDFEDRALSPGLCWHFYDKAQELLALSDPKWRLEKQAGEIEYFLQRCKVFDAAPYTLEYKLYITKTHLVEESLPAFYGDIDTTNSIEKCCEFVNKNLDCVKSDVTGDDRNHSVIRAYVTGLMSAVGSSYDYLMQSQLDEQVRVETFWSRCGFESKDTPVKGKLAGIISFQFKTSANFQVRTDRSLREVVSAADPLCSGPVNHEVYAPKVYAQGRYFQRPTNIAGSWIGDRCPNIQLSVVALPQAEMDDYISRCGHDLVDGQTRQAAVTLGFATAMSQALNQGANSLIDIQQPIVSQVAVVAGPLIRFCVYQLNTTRLWMSDGANHKRNLSWVSPEMNLLQDGRSNDEVSSQLLKFLVNTPSSEAVLPPRVPLINNKGEEHIDKPPIGRFELPKNSVYFQ